LYDIVCVILHLSILVRARLVTDRRTHDDSIYYTEHRMVINVFWHINFTIFVTCDQLALLTAVHEVPFTIYTATMPTITVFD